MLITYIILAYKYKLLPFLGFISETVIHINKSWICKKTSFALNWSVWHGTFAMLVWVSFCQFKGTINGLYSRQNFGYTARLLENIYIVQIHSFQMFAGLERYFSIDYYYSIPHHDTFVMAVFVECLHTADITDKLQTKNKAA